jgi:hypothetical protein
MVFSTLRTGRGFDVLFENRNNIRALKRERALEVSAKFTSWRASAPIVFVIRNRRKLQLTRKQNVN